MTKIDNILKKAKVTLDKIKPNLTHHIFNTKYEARDNFNDLKECYDGFYTKGTEPRMIGLSGLRGTGKTTLLWQIAEYAYNKGMQKEIYYFNVETLTSYGHNIFDIFAHFDNNKQELLTEKIVLLFDEVHTDPEWSKSLKIFYDEMKTAYIVATGSSALLLQTTADLATRMLMLKTFPLHFTEYISITKNIKLDNQTEFQKTLKNALFFSKDLPQVKARLQDLQPAINLYLQKLNNINNLIDIYIKYHNITRFTLYENNNFLQKEINTLYHRVIYEDIPLLTDKINSKDAKNILLRLASSDEINIQTLSERLGIPQKQVNDTIEILGLAELLNVLYPHGKIDSKLNKKKKAFFMSPSIRLALFSELYDNIDKEFVAKLYEDIVVMYLKRFFDNAILSFSSYSDSKNPDFIISTRESPILLEVGINKKTTKQITKSKIKYRYGIIINTKIDEIEFRNNTVMIPLKWFLLL